MTKQEIVSMVHAKCNELGCSIEEACIHLGISIGLYEWACNEIRKEEIEIEDRDER